MRFSKPQSPLQWPAILTDVFLRVVQVKPSTTKMSAQAAAARNRVWSGAPVGRCSQGTTASCSNTASTTYCTIRLHGHLNS